MTGMKTLGLLRSPEQASCPGNACSLLDSLIFAEAFQSPYSPKYLLPRPLISQAFLSVAFPNCHPLSPAAVTNTFAFKCFQQTHCGKLPQLWVSSEAGKTKASIWADSSGSHQIGQNTQPQFFETKVCIASSGFSNLPQESRLLSSWMISSWRVGDGEWVS